MKLIPHILAALLLTAASHAARADDFATRCSDRAAIERVYHEHRTGTKQPFEEAMPREMIARLVRQDLQKEAVLRKVYGMEITPAMVAAEVERINTTTRAPEVLAEIKHALGDDPARFAAAMARPILVERELRRRFDNDDKLHAAQRREAEQARESLLAKKPVKDMRDVTWQLSRRLDDGKSEIRILESATTNQKRREEWFLFGGGHRATLADRHSTGQIRAWEGEDVCRRPRSRTAKGATGAIAKAGRRERGDRNTRRLPHFPRQRKERRHAQRRVSHHLQAQLRRVAGAAT